MVFKNVSWQAFLVAALALAGVWYLLVLPLLYRRQLKDWLGSRKGKPDLRPVCRDWDEEMFEEPLAEAEDGLIGQSRLPAGLSRVGMNMFGFADPLEASDGLRELQQGLVPDVIEELKSIFHILEKEQGGKDDFIALFALVKSKYAAIRDTPSQRALNDYIRENALFPISDDELTNLWN
ncbi:hypothetical protein [Mucilaginibacter rubeus]|uniref:Uncharacterized protein n=1 Tax=Mucilaginibacter rubeus TaxID=2027860 RepID=A0A5C1HTL7_9SPHI|nr:hypothetical protein [Mucilaginibacter rubeus]QEM09176.1 hypothetical protein DEO27_003795 [Mucilaginibacter rubeus]